MKRLVFVSLYFLITILSAQQKTEVKGEDEFGIKFKGFVKTDVMFDTRQTISIREGHFLLYPQPEIPDPNNEDVNKKTSLNMLSIQSRLTGTITGPRAFGAKTSGVLEGAFFGHSEADVNAFRLRHAFLKLDWENSSLLIGQYWNPMFITEVFPGTISFNTGVPFQPFSRNPQIRFTQKFENVDISFTASSQRDFTSTGPQGASSVYLRNSSIPMLDVNLKYQSQSFLIGAGGGVKSLVPQIVTDKGISTDEKINSISAMGFLKVSSGDFTIKAEGVYGENMTDFVMLGGYAVSAKDAATGLEKYTAIKTLSAWTDLSYGGNVQFGLFAGYTKNLGANDVIVGNVYARGSNIDKVIRVSPRIIFKAGATQLAGEVEMTTASYGTPDSKGKVQNTKDVTNIRLLIAAYLFF